MRLISWLILPLLLTGCQQAGGTPMAPQASATPPAAVQHSASRPSVGILAYEGMQIIDYAGPYEVFGQAGFDVFLVAEHAGPMTTAMGQVVTPRYTFADAPALDVLVIPGGEVPPVAAAQANPAILDFVRSVQTRARHVLSVCNGAFILAETGLLAGKTATTHHGLLVELQAKVPTARVVADQRFVDNGQIITTAGLTSGMDGALHVVSEERGRGMAQQVALNLEYDWRPEAGYARAKLADMGIARALAGATLPKYAAEGALRIVSTEGDERQWTTVMDVTGKGDARAVGTLLASDFSKAGWRTASPAVGTEHRWTFEDPAGRPWKGHTQATEAADGVRIEIRVEAGQ